MFPAHETAEVKATDAMDVDAPEQLRGSALLFEQQLSNMNLNEDMDSDSIDQQMSYA